MRFVFLLALLTARVARAGDPPCDGCVYVPADGEHRPLLVLMHGDDQAASAIVDTFRETAKERDLAVFAPQCPAKLGCGSSYWRWNGDPKWLLGQIDKVVKDHELDAKRVFIIGWSGGAAYIGYWFTQLAPKLSAVVFVGGGSPGGSCPKTKLPILTISGDKNPHHDLMQISHDKHVGCGHKVTWKLMPGKDHDDEWRALEKPETQREIYDFCDPKPKRSEKR